MAVKKIDYSRRLPVSSMLRMYNVLQDWDGEKFLNIFKSFEINPETLEKQDVYDLHIVDEDEWWDNISFKFYDTPYFWWTIALINNTENPFESLESGEEIRVLRYEYLYILLDDIKDVARL